MSPSRRRTIELFGVGAALLAGCSGLDAGPNEPNPTPTPGNTTFEVRLQGPETDRVLFDAADVETVGRVQIRPGSVYVPITLTDQARAAVAEAFGDAGVADEPDAFEIVQQFEDRRDRFEVSPDLAEEIAAGEWDGRLAITAANETRAAALRRSIRGAGVATATSRQG